MCKFLIYRTKEGIVEYTLNVDRELITDRFLELYECNLLSDLKSRLEYWKKSKKLGELSYKTEVYMKPVKTKDCNDNKADTLERKKQKKYYETIKLKKKNKLNETMSVNTIISSLNLL